MFLWFRDVYPCMLYIGPLEHSGLNQYCPSNLNKTSWISTFRKPLLEQAINSNDL
uniref:CcmC-1 n=1 Tax=Arundo donax TaxID=35708 RepID=A0A0A9T1I5_ARUDO